MLTRAYWIVFAAAVLLTFVSIWIVVPAPIFPLLVLGVTEPPAARDKAKNPVADFKNVLSTTLVRDGATRLVFLNLVVLGTAGLVMVWTRQKYWQDIGVPLAYFGALDAAYQLLSGFAGRSTWLAGSFAPVTSSWTTNSSSNSPRPSIVFVPVPWILAATR